MSQNVTLHIQQQVQKMSSLNADPRLVQKCVLLWSLPSSTDGKTVTPLPLPQDWSRPSLLWTNMVKRGTLRNWPQNGVFTQYGGLPASFHILVLEPFWFVYSWSFSQESNSEWLRAVTPPTATPQTTSPHHISERLWHIWMNCACAMNKRSPLVRSDIVCPLPLSLNPLPSHPPPPVPTVPGEDDGPGEPTGRDVCAAGWRRGCGRGFQRQGHIRLHAQRLHCARLQHSPWHRCTHTSHISIDRQVKCIL